MAFKRNLSAAAPRPCNPAEPLDAKGLSWPAVIAAVLSLAVLPFASLQASAAASTSTSPATPNGRVARLVQVPLNFEPNQGQADARVQFLSRGRGYSLYLTPGEVVLDLEEQKTKAQQPASETLRMKLLQANVSAQVDGLDPLSGHVNYFLGNDPKQWRSNIPTYGKVKYAEVYPGIDLVFYGNQRQLEYDFLVAAGADPGRIAWQIDGATASVAADGSLQLHTSDDPVSFKKPVIYQQHGAARTEIPGAFQVSGNLVRFTLGAYDHSEPLVIDPVLTYVSYLGGAASESSSTDGLTQIGSSPTWNPGAGGGNVTQALAVDSEGDVYVTGYTNATNFPVVNPIQGTSSAIDATTRATAAFVTKFNPEGTGLIYSTYLGGTSSGAQDEGAAVAVDAEGNAYVVGLTDSGNFPVTAGAFQTICGANYDSGGRINGCGFEAQVDGFLTKLDPTGSKLVYSTFLGGGNDQIFAVAVDAKGQAYVAGNSSDYQGPNQPAYYAFPTTAGAVLSGGASYVYQPSDSDYGLYTGFAFLTVFDAAGANLLYSTYIGDNTALIASGAVKPGVWGPTYATAVTLDSAGDIFVAGATQAPNLPTTSGVLQGKPTSLPNDEGWIAKFKPLTKTGTMLDYLTYFGGPDRGALLGGLAADSAGEVYITGLNTDAKFPTTTGAYQTACGFTGDPSCENVFVSKLNASGSALLWSTMFGDYLNGEGITANQSGPIQLDSKGDVYIAGEATSLDNFPQVNPVEPATGANFQAFVAEFNPTGSKLLFTTLLGSGGTVGTQSAAGLAVDSDGNMYVAGNTDAPNSVITTPGAFQTTFDGYYAAFVAKISSHAASATKLTVSPSSATFGQKVTLTAVVSGPANSTTPTGTVVFKNGSTTLDTVTLDSGKATYTMVAPAPKTYSLTASYSGDTTFLASVSSAESLKVVPAPTAITLKSSLNPAFPKETITFTAQVKASSGTAIPSGTISILDGTTVLTTETVPASGVLTFSDSSLAVGTHAISARYNATSDFATSTSAPVSEVIEADIATKTVLSASATSITLGTAVTLSAHVTPVSGNAAPTGTVSFYLINTLLGKVTLNSTGEAALATTPLVAGTDPYTAHYSGGIGNSASVSNTVDIKISKAAAN